MKGAVSAQRALQGSERETRELLGRNVREKYGHFVTGHGKNPDAYLEVTGIEKVLPLGNDQLRKIRESYWINQYDSISYGANTRE